MRRTQTKLCHALFVVGLAAAIAPIACAQIATLDKGHQLLVNSGLQIWGCDTGASSFTYGNLTGANFNAVMWSHGQSNAGLLSAGQKWGKWVDYTLSPATALDSTENAHYADLVAIQVGDEQQSDLESPNSLTTTWFQNARNGNYFNDKLLYVNSFFINSDAAYATFIANANPDAIAWDAYPFGSGGIQPINWLGKAQQFRRHALGAYISGSGNAPRPYGLYLQTYSSTTEARRDPGDLEMRWQQFTAWTLGNTFVDAFTVGGATSLFNGGSMSSPNQPRYNQFKETARQGQNLGPALVRLISYSNGPAGGGTSIVRGKDPAGNLNPLPISWQDFSPNDAPPNQRYLTGVSAVNLGTKNNGQPGDVYIGYFNPLHASYGDPVGTAYFMVTNALGAYLQDPTLLVTDTTQQITMNFDFGYSTMNSLQRLRRSDGHVELVPLTHVSGSQYQFVFNLEGGTGDLFKFNNGHPFVGAQTVMPTVYWDNDATAAGNNTSTGADMGGSGNWDTISSKWYNDASNGTWTSNLNPVFWGTAGTVTVVSPPSVDSLAFKTNGYTIAGSSITMNRPFVTVDSGVTATISSTVTGASGLAKSGPGTLRLAAANNYTGGTTINQGVVQVSSDAALGAAPSTLRTDISLNGGTLQWGADFDLSNNRGIGIGPNGGTIDTQGFTNPSGYNALQGGFRGPGNLTKLGSGTFFAAAPSGGANTSWTGRLILKDGTWKIVASDGLPYNVPAADGLQPAQVTLDGGTWQMGATMNVTNGRRGVTIAAGGGTVDTQGFNLAWSGPWAGSSTSAVLNKIGSGTLRLNSNSTYGPGTYAGILNVNGGTLQIDGGTAMGDLAAINLANTAGASMSVTGSVGESIGSLSGGGPSGGNLSLSASLTTGGNNSSTTFSGLVSGAGGLTKTGSGVFTLAPLTSGNTYGGGTTINGGTLRVNNASGSGVGGGNVTVNSGGTLGGSGLVGTGTDSANVNVNSGGHIASGSSAGTLTVFGDVTFAAGSFFDVELGGLAAGTEFDRLTVNGAVALGGTLNVAFTNNFTPSGASSFEIISATGGINGTTFSNMVLPSLPAGLIWHMTYSTNSVVLTAALAGDFNLDNSVDAADYVVWRNGLGTLFTPADYDAWRANFGKTLSSGAAVIAVPEPRAWVLLGVGGAILFAYHWR